MYEQVRTDGVGIAIGFVTLAACSCLASAAPRRVNLAKFIVSRSNRLKQGLDINFKTVVPPDYAYSRLNRLRYGPLGDHYAQVIWANINRPPSHSSPTY